MAIPNPLEDTGKALKKVPKKVWIIAIAGGLIIGIIMLKKRNEEDTVAEGEEGYEDYSSDAVPDEMVSYEPSPTYDPSSISAPVGGGGAAPYFPEYPSYPEWPTEFASDDEIAPTDSIPPAPITINVGSQDAPEGGSDKGAHPGPRTKGSKSKYETRVVKVNRKRGKNAPLVEKRGNVLFVYDYKGDGRLPRNPEVITKKHKDKRDGRPRYEVIGGSVIVHEYGNLPHKKGPGHGGPPNRPHPAKGHGPALQDRPGHRRPRHKGKQRPTGRKRKHAGTGGR